MTDPQDETLENQTGQPGQPDHLDQPDQTDPIDPPISPLDSQEGEELQEDKENEVVEESVPLPPQFQSPYFPNGVYEDARTPEKTGISYDPFTAQSDTEESPDDAPRRKMKIILGVIVLALIAALVFALVTGRLVLPF